MAMAPSHAHDPALGIRLLTGGHLQSYEAPRPSLADSQSPLLRIIRAPRSRAGAPSAFEQLLTGLWPVGLPLVYGLLREAGELAVFIGAGEQNGGTLTLESLLHGHLAGSGLLSLDPECLHDPLHTWPHGLCLIGVPTPTKRGVSALVRGMPSEGWLYLVAAQPILSDEIQSSTAWLAEETRRVANAHLRQGTIESANQPLARHYHRLLNRSLRHWHQGATTGMWRTKVFLLARDREALALATPLLSSVFSGKSSTPQPIRVLPSPPIPGSRPGHDSPGTELPTALAAEFIALPEEEAPGFRISPVHTFSQSPVQSHGRTLQLGRLLTSTGVQSNEVSLDPEQLLRHTFIAGLTGSGKSTTAQSLLSQLWRDHRIPFLVIEPAKREYRRLLAHAELSEMLVFTLGDEREAPFRVNPLEVQPGVPVQTHVDLLRTLFQATFAGLYPPMPYLLEQALIECYEEFGWDLTMGVGESGKASPTMADLLRKAREVADAAGYDPEITQNVRTALQVRLGSLLVGAKGRMLNVQRSMPTAALLERPVLLELASIGDPDLSAFLIGLFLIRLYEHFTWSAGPSDRLRHVTLVEEAHRLLAHNTGSAHPDTSSVRTMAVETICQMLMETRAYGAGMIIVDQSPSKLHPDVLRGTSVKMAHRMVAEEERRALGGCMAMSAGQVRSLSTLRVGEAAVYGEGWEQPVLVAVTELPRPTALGSRGEEVREHMRPHYAANPAWLSESPAPPPRPTPGGRPSPRLVQEFDALIATSEPEMLWQRLADLLLAEVHDTVASDQRTTAALSLGLAVAHAMDLPQELRQRLARGLASVLLEEAR